MARRMKPGECRTTRRGMRYCNTPDGVRFVGKRGVTRRRWAYSGAYPDLGAARRGGRMRVGECRRTSRGVKYCRTRKGVRFVRG